MTMPNLSATRVPTLSSFLVTAYHGWHKYGQLHADARCAGRSVDAYRGAGYVDVRVDPDPVLDSLELLRTPKCSRCMTPKDSA